MGHNLPHHSALPQEKSLLDHAVVRFSVRQCDPSAFYIDRAVNLPLRLCYTWLSGPGKPRPRLAATPAGSAVPLKSSNASLIPDPLCQQLDCSFGNFHTFPSGHSL
jgi:hypothetical protein